jgi:phage terminase large subunit GpA-like protein
MFWVTNGTPGRVPPVPRATRQCSRNSEQYAFLTEKSSWFQPRRSKASRIEEAFLGGTQEEWRVMCPNCGEYHFIEFKDIVFDHKIYLTITQTVLKRLKP